MRIAQERARAMGLVALAALGGTIIWAAAGDAPGAEDAPIPLVACGSGGPSCAAAADDHDGHDHGDEHAHGEAESDSFSPEALAPFGVTVAAAAPGTVDFGVSLPGEVRPDPNRVAHLAPRFPGIVRSVSKQVGDRVRAGDVLAIVESETLAPYPVKAGMDGVVLDRHAAVGEAVDREDTLFVVADLSQIWVHVSIYQEDVERVRAGQTVRVVAGHGIPDAETAITYVAPVVDQASRTASARAVLPNPDGLWRPGLFVMAHVLDPVEAAIVVPRTALQTVDGRTVVFVAEHDRFVPRPVAVGRTGRTTVEITSGLRPGERYAATETFLVKAELGKSEAEHAH